MHGKQQNKFALKMANSNCIVPSENKCTVDQIKRCVMKNFYENYNRHNHYRTKTEVAP